MSDELNVSGTEPSEGSDIASEVASDLSEFLEKDPQAVAAKKVAADLEGMDLNDPGEPEAAGGDDSPGGDDTVQSAIADIFSKRNELVEQRKVSQQESQVSSQAQQMLQQAQQAQHEAQRLMAEARQAAAWAQQLKSDPVKALQAAGVDPEAFIMQLAGSPQEVATSKELQELKAWKAEQVRKEAEQERLRQEANKQAQLQQLTQFRQQVETEFFTKAEAKKHIKQALEDGFTNKTLLKTMGDTVADEYRELTGKEASLEDIATYIDIQVGKAYSKRNGAQQVAAPVTAPKPGPSTKKARQTLTADDASERRTLDRPISPDASEEERIAQAKRAVAQVLKKHPEKD